MRLNLIAITSKEIRENIKTMIEDKIKIQNIVKIDKEILRILEQDDQIHAYLSELASGDFKNPDKCDQWANEYIEENKEEIVDEMTEDIIKYHHMI